MHYGHGEVVGATGFLESDPRPLDVHFYHKCHEKHSHQMHHSHLHPQHPVQQDVPDGSSVTVVARTAATDSTTHASPQS